MAMLNQQKRHMLSIGMFDSGLGGLTVMQQVLRLLPNERIVYFGDTARVPYGGKGGDTIIRYSIENTIFLMEQNIKMLVIPCNTATAYALDRLRQIFNIPIIGVIEPGAEKVTKMTKNGRIAVIGTKASISSGVFQREIKRYLPEAHIEAVACPLFVPLVEERFVSHPSAKLIVKEYLAPLKDKGVDTLLLGCTHYPLMHQLIAEEVGDQVTIVDSAVSCAEKVKAFLLESKMEAEPSTIPPQHQFYVSDDPEKFRLSGGEFLGMPLDNVKANSLYLSSCK